MTVLTERGKRVPAHPRNWAWRSGPCQALGHCFEVVADNAQDCREQIEPVIAPFRVGSGTTTARRPQYQLLSESDGPQTHVLAYEGERLAGGSRVFDLVGMLTWHINQRVIERTVPDQVLLHAAAAVRGGVTVILPADQESGKTTTVAGLLREGYDYLTDEAVAIDPVTTSITPFPKTLSLDPGSWDLFPECRPSQSVPWQRQWHVPTDVWGAHSLTEPAPPPGVVVFPRYVQGATTRLERVTPAAATRELARMSFEFPRHAGRNLRVLAQVARQATSARLVIGSLSSAIDAIDSLVSERIMEEL